MSDTKLKKGIKLSAAEAKAMDPAKMGVAVLQPPARGEVEGQGYLYESVVTPCGAVTWLWYDTEEYHWYTCGVGGEAFKL